MDNNKGFTLVELLVCVVIFGIVLAAAFGFMLASAKTYNKVNDRLEIQNQSQAALNLIEEYVIDCNLGISFVPSDEDYVKDGISYPTGTLYILDQTGVNSYTVHIFKLGSDETLRYAEVTSVTANKDVTGEITSYSFSEPTGDKVTDKAVEFTASYTPDTETLEIGTVNITLGMIKRSATYEGTINIALRNKPVLATVNP
jgi:prepilin-type N-terminal cleavage/methylation domain-containing protein